MTLRFLMAAGVTAAFMAGCGGGGAAPPLTVDAGAPATPTTPAAPQSSYKPVTCPQTAAALAKSTIKVGAVDRTYFDVGPSNYAALRENDARALTVVVNFHDAGQDGQSGTAETCWHEVGEAKGFITVFPSALNGSWNTKATSTEADDLAFLKALLPAIKTKYAIASNAMVYYAGVGQGSRMAQAMAMQAPQFLAGVAGVGGAAEADVFNLPSTALPPTTMAAWIIRKSATDADATEARQVEYWNANNAVTKPAVAVAEVKFDSQLYASTTNPNQRVKVSTPKIDGYAGKELTQDIWDGLFGTTVRFFDDNRVNGSMRANQSIADMKLVESSKEFIAGAPRRWLTYVPSNYATLTAGGKKIPLVLSLHGRNGSARWQATTSQWHAVAEKYGFIVVYPQGTGATWNGSMDTTNPDVAFMQSLITEVSSRYAIDSTRVYMNGASMGSLMTNRMAVQFPTLFAAIAPCYSGHLSPANYTNAIVRTDVPMPVWQCRGQDEVPSDFPGGTAGEVAAQVFWRETVNKNSGVPTLQADGRKVTNIWNNGLAEYRWQVTEYQPHFWHEGQSEKIWTEMFSKYQRLATGALVRVP
jgi:poly(3-hydroxybutyrate) depolymerase